MSSVQWKVVWGRGSQCELLQFGSVGGEAVHREFWIVGFEFELPAALELLVRAAPALRCHVSEEHWGRGGGSSPWSRPPAPPAPPLYQWEAAVEGQEEGKQEGVEGCSTGSSAIF